MIILHIHSPMTTLFKKNRSLFKKNQTFILKTRTYFMKNHTLFYILIVIYIFMLINGNLKVNL